MSIIPIQNLIIDDDTDIGLSADLIIGSFKTTSLTDLSKNVYTSIFDLSGNLNSSINTKQNILTVSTPLIKNDFSNNIRIDLSAYALTSSLSNYASTSSLSNYALNSSLSNYALSSSLSNYALTSSLSSLNASNLTSGTVSISRGGIGTNTLTANQILIGNAATSILQSSNLTITTTRKIEVKEGKNK